MATSSIQSALINSLPPVTIDISEKSIDNVVRLRMTVSKVDAWEKKFTTWIEDRVRQDRGEKKSNPVSEVITEIKKETSEKTSRLQVPSGRFQEISREYTELVNSILEDKNGNQRLFDVLDLCSDTYFREITFEILDHFSCQKLPEMVFEQPSTVENVNLLVQTYPRMVNLLGKIVPASSIKLIQFGSEDSIDIHFHDGGIEILRSKAYAIKIKFLYSFLVEQWSFGLGGQR